MTLSSPESYLEIEEINGILESPQQVTSVRMIIS